MNRTSYGYDSMNRLAQRTDPLGRVETFGYDADGNLTTTTDRKGQALSFAYDVVDQLITKTLPGNLVTSFAYDAVGNLTAVIDPDSRLVFQYDGASRLMSAATTGSPNQPEAVIDYTISVPKRGTGQRKILRLEKGLSPSQVAVMIA